MDAPLLPGKGQILFRGQDDILTPTVKYVSYLNPVNHGRANGPIRKPILLGRAISVAYILKGGLNFA